MAFGDLDEFEHFVELINHLLERLGNFRGVRNGLTDSGSFRRTKISGLDPRLRTQRFGTAFGATIALRFAGEITLRPSFRRARNFCDGFCLRRFRRISLVRSKIGGCFRVRFAEITGSIALVMFGVFNVFGSGRVGFERFRRGRNFFGSRCASLSNHGTRSATTTTATTTTAIAAGTARGRGRFQIGIFVRHKF